MRNLRCFTLALLILFAFSIVTFAQKTDYKPGEKIEYLAATYPEEVWEEGVFVGKTYDGSQPIIRQKPNQFYKQGFETAFHWTKIRPLSTQTVIPTPTTNDTQKPENTTTPDTAPNIDGKGLMTKEEIFSYLRANLPKAPDDPNAAKVSKQIVKEIKQRGVEYFKVEDRDIYNVFMRYDPRHDQVVRAIQENYGAPTPQSWLMGRWTMTALALGRYGSAAGKGGFLMINKNGTYQWKPGANDEVINGKWREATEEEMWYQGGAGVVLLKGEAGDDWIARKSTNRELKGDHIDVALLDLTYRGGKRRIGRR